MPSSFEPHPGSASAYVIACADSEPVELLRLVWHLVVVQRRHLLGVEVWTPGEARGAVVASLQRRWPDLRRTVGPLPGLGLDAPPGCGPGVRVHGVAAPEAGWSRLAGQARALALIAAVHDRVQYLRGALDAVELVGLEGGVRAAPGAVLHAFVLQARAGDRLVRVVVHPDLDGALAFELPDPRWTEDRGVPVAAQVDVWQVPAARLRVAGRRVVAGLDQPFRRFWSVRAVGSGAHAVLEQRLDRGWDYVVRCGDEILASVPLSDTRGAVLAALASGEVTDDAALYVRVQQRARRREPAEDAQVQATNAARARTRLREQLERDLPAELGDFVPRGRTLVGRVRVVPPGTAEHATGPRVEGWGSGRGGDEDPERTGPRGDRG